MDGYISASAVKRDYGFTEALIKRFLPEPRLVENPFYRSAAPMRMYAVSDVEAAEQNPEFAEAKEKASRRSASSAAAAERRRQAFIECCNGISITIPVIDRRKLIDKAKHHKQQHYNYLNAISDGFRYDSRSAFDCHDEETIKRWCCNYLRHQCTDYDDVLSGFKGKIGRDEGYEIYHDRVNEEIKKIYPYLFDASPLYVPCESKKED